MITKTNSFSINESRVSRSPSEGDGCPTLPSKNIPFNSPFQSEPISENNFSLTSSAYLDRYPNAALWNNVSTIESVAPGCRLEPDSVSFLSTVLNTCKALLGAGIVWLPMIFSEASLIPGILIFTSAVLLSSLSFWIIGYLSHRTHHKSWGGMFKSILSHSNCDLPQWLKNGAPIDIIIIIANICNGCSYTIIASANFVNVIQDWFNFRIPPNIIGLPQSQWEIENPLALQRREYATIILTFCLLFPLNFVNLRKVSCVSVLGIVATALLVFVVAVCGPPMQAPILWNPNPKTIGSFSRFSIAVCAHSISPNFYQALERKTPSKFAKTTSSGYSIILMMNLVVGICGYLRFGDNVQANILESYSTSDVSSMNAFLVNVARICISLSVLVNHSFQSRAFSTAVGNVAPSWLINLELCKPKEYKSQQITNTYKNNDKMKIIKILSRSTLTGTGGTNSPRVISNSPRVNLNQAHLMLNPQDNEKSQLLIRIAYTVIVLLISFYVKRLKVLFQLTAPLISSSLVYTIPGVMLLMLGILSKAKENERLRLKLLTICGTAFILIGLFCTTTGLYAFIYDS